MAGTFFDYFDGYLRVEFGHYRYDWIRMLLTLHGDAIAATPCDDKFEKGQPETHVTDDAQIHMHISSVWCAFGSLIRWLEAVVIGVQECAFTWDAEGPDGKLHWQMREWENGFLTVSWYSKETTERRVMLNKAQMVGEFYRKFRAFVESNQYDPLRYEEMGAGEAVQFVLEDSTADDLADAIARRSRIKARALLGAFMLVVRYRGCPDAYQGPHPPSVPLGYCIELATTREEYFFDDDTQPDPRFPPEWETWDFANRKAHTLNFTLALGRGSDTSWYGSNLRELRSEIVENWLAEQLTRQKNDKADSA